LKIERFRDNIGLLYEQTDEKNKAKAFFDEAKGIRKEIKEKKV